MVVIEERVQLLKIIAWGFGAVVMTSSWQLACTKRGVGELITMSYVYLCIMGRSVS